MQVIHRKLLALWILESSWIHRKENNACDTYDLWHILTYDVCFYKPLVPTVYNLNLYLSIFMIIHDSWWIRHTYIRHVLLDVLSSCLYFVVSVQFNSIRIWLIHFVLTGLEYSTPSHVNVMCSMTRWLSIIMHTKEVHLNICNVLIVDMIHSYASLLVLNIRLARTPVLSILQYILTKLVRTIRLLYVVCSWLMSHEFVT